MLTMVSPQLLLHVPFILFLPLAFSPTIFSHLEAERDALLLLRAAVGGQTLRWNIADPTPCSWYGVECNTAIERVIELRLPGDNLSGELPPNTIGNLTALRVLSLRGNLLRGQVPADIGSCTELTSLDLQENEFSGELPPGFFQLSNLSQANLAVNKFSGGISPGFGNLTRLRGLHLENNQFSGPILGLNSLSELTELNVSFNSLTGSIPSNLSSFSSQSFLGNTLCGAPLESCPSEAGSHIRLILGIVASTSGIAVLAIIVLFLRRKYSTFCHKMEEYQNVETFLKNNCCSLAPKRYNYSDVKKMTSSFMTKLGEGGYGSVYKGKFHDGSFVAVKILDGTKGNGEEFINEVATISRTSHVNIVKLLGFCFERNRRALIYEFMLNGSLEKFIFDNQSILDRQLGWQTLYKIAIGIARGLEYLHCRCNAQILHFDIKPHNILLDEDFSPKISDFGLSKLCTRTKSIVSILGARGTIGYIAPEVVCRTFGAVSHKSDVYSYGMMILEMVGGRKNIDVEVDHTSEIYYPHWIYKQLELNQELGLDGVLDEEDTDKARRMIIVSLWCIQTNPSSRPSMTKVVEMLEGNLESLQIPPKPYLYSPSQSP